MLSIIFDIEKSDNMSWLKKQMNKIFNIDEEYEEFYETDEQYVNEQPKREQQQKKAAFRFPLIADDEVIEKQQPIKPAPMKEEQYAEEPFNLPKHLRQEPQVYNVEVSGISELLARRQKNRGQVNTFRAEKPTRHHVTDEEAAFLTGQKRQRKTEQLEKNTLPQSRKRFVPTDVPSPVHGFKKAKSIDELLIEKERAFQPVEKVVAPTFTPEAEIVEENVEQWEEKHPLEEISAQGQAQQQSSLNTTDDKGVAHAYTEEEDFDLLNELKVENLTIENSTIHIGQLHVEQAPEAHTGSRLPFNVLMLKSDKQKQLAKEFVKEHLQTQNQKEQKVTMLKHEKKLAPNIAPVAEEIVTERIEEKTPIQDTPMQKLAEEVVKQEVVQMDATLHYEKPSTSFLAPPERQTEDVDWMEQQAEALVEALSYHQVAAQVESIMQGPAVTQFEITIGQGTKVSKIRNLSDDLKLALAAKDIRIQAPIPGKRTIGIEIPNLISRAVRLSEVTNSAAFKSSDSPLEAALGLDLTGKPVTLDLRKMPHGLIAGATGSGKSVCINSILVSLLYKADPHELKLMLIDPKMVELAPFNHIPHLVSPVITDVKAAAAALKWAVEEMERRYQLFMHAEVRDITRFNMIAEANGQHAQKLPYLLIVIDELADLMMMAPTDVEDAICRIAQKARACGIHLIVATQRPSVDVITGLIKANIPTRIAFAVSSQIDSRTILDIQGAERLLGRGDMLYLGNGMSAPQRLQGTFVTDDEIEEVIRYVRSQGTPDYIFEQDELLKKAEIIEAQDELFEEICRFVYEQGSISVSSIQRKYHIGYNRAARLVEMLEQHGFVSEQRGSKPRESFITEADLENLSS